VASEDFIRYHLHRSYAYYYIPLYLCYYLEQFEQLLMHYVKLVKFIV